MSDHLKRYQNYVNSLKSGNSSGISAAFGRAADILPPEALEVKVPKTSKDAEVKSSAPHQATAKVATAATVPLAPFNLSDQVLTQDLPARELLRNTIDEIVSNCASSMEDPIGAKVITENGEQEVISVYLEEGQRMFLLSDLAMLTEQEFAAALTTEPSEPIETTLHPFSHFQNLSPLAEASETIEVMSPTGALLWHVYYKDNDVSLISMADGGLIKRAEGRKEFVFSTLSQVDFDIKIYILSGLIVDPLTGNIYVEVNQGAYTAAFLNNGWSVHQYRQHDGSEACYVTEPVRPDKATSMVQVNELKLNMHTGEVSYEAMDNSANITLRCRTL